MFKVFIKSLFNKSYIYIHNLKHFTSDYLIYIYMGDRTKWQGQNGTDKMAATFIDSNSTELNFYSVITSHK